MLYYTLRVAEDALLDRERAHCTLCSVLLDLNNYPTRSALEKPGRGRNKTYRVCIEANTYLQELLVDTVC